MYKPFGPMAGKKYLGGKTRLYDGRKKVESERCHEAAGNRHASTLLVGYDLMVWYRSREMG